MNEYMDLIRSETMTCDKSKDEIQIWCCNGHCLETYRRQEIQN